MTIERLNIPEGVPIVEELLDPIKLIEKLVNARRDQFHVLETGVYDLTPPDESREPMRTELKVLENGTGKVRITSMSNNGLVTARLVPAPEAEATSEKSQIIHIPGDVNRFTVIGNRQPNPRVYRIFDIIRWTP